MTEIRFLHFADLHLGVENYGRVNPETGLSTRLEDFLRSFDAIVDRVLNDDIDLVVFAGDAFKNRTPSPTYEREFALRIRRLAGHVPVFLLVGNHDLPNARGRAHTLEIYQTLGIPNVYVARKPDLFTIPTKRGKVQVLAVPWVVRSTFLSKEKTRGRSLSEVEALMMERLFGVVHTLQQNANPDLPLVMAAHATVQGATYGSERSVMLGHDLILPTSLFRHPKVTYGALGHIHKHQQVIADPPVVYSGSPERIDFGEEKEEKGYIVGRLYRQRGGGWAAEWEFVPLRTRPFVTIRVDARGESATETIVAEIQRHPIEDAVVRLFIHTDAESEPHIDDRRIREALEPAFYVAAMHREVEREVRLRLGGDKGVEALSPLELLQRYFVSIGKDDGRIKVLVRYAQALLAEE